MPKEYKYRKTFTFEGKRYEAKADTQAELYMRMANRIRDLEEGKVTVSGNTTIKNWAKKCIDECKTNQKEITQKKYRARMEKCVIEPIGNRTLKSLKPIDCQAVINLQKGNSKYQINQTFQMLNFIFEKAVENNLILKNPAKNITKPLGTVTERRSLTEFETEHFLKCAIKERRFYSFLLMYYCGCRPSEAIKCKGMDIKKIEEQNVLHIRGGKTIASDRLVPIPDKLYHLIKNTPKFEHIVLNNANKNMDESSWRRSWASLKREMNISMGCTVQRNELIPPYPLATDVVPYCLRHSYCTNLCKQEVDIRAAQYLMGHSTIELTANIYTHADNSTVIKAAKKINAYPDVYPDAADTGK